MRRRPSRTSGSWSTNRTWITTATGRGRWRGGHDV